MIGATVEVADFEEFKTPQIAWILLRTFVDNHEIARHAWKSSGLRPNIFQYCGFGGALIYEFLKLLCTTDQPPDITELRQMFPGYFKTLDRVDFRFDHVAPVARFLIDEARYLHNARALGLSDNIEVDDRSRRHVVERQIRNRIAVRIRALCSALLPYGDDFGEDWVALSRGLGSIAVRVKGSTIGYWHASNGDHSISSRSAVLLVQAIQNLNLSAALDWITNFFDRAGEAAAGPSPPLAPVAPQVVEEVIPPDHDPPSPTPADVIPIEEETPPPPTQPVVKMEEQPSVPYISAARMAEIEAANLEAMLALASAGVPVFPARLDWNAEANKWDKRPAITGWKKAATTDLEQIRAWRRKLPLRLGLPAHRLVPGIWCGHRDLNFIVIDADRHGGPDGVAAFDALVAKHGLPPGPITATASSGFHYIFKQPDGKPLGNHDGVLHDQGINVRGCTGWIVGPGSMRPDGAMWCTADDSTSVIEAFRNGTITTIPAWFVNIVRPPKPDKPEKAPKAKIQTKAAKPAPSTAPPSSGKRVSSRSMDRRGKAWAEIVLKNGAADLAAMPPHSGRNETANALGFQMGTMVRRGWADRNTVFNTVFTACETNNVAQEDGPDRIRNMIERAIAAGMLEPHPDLADGRTRAGRQRSGEHDDVWLKLRRIEVYRLMVVRHGEHATMKLFDDVLNGLEDLDAYEFGKRLNFTLVEYQEIGRRFGRHPSTIQPCDATREHVDAYLASIREAKKPERAEAEKARRLRKKQEEAQQPPTNDLVAQRCAALVAYAKRYPGKHKTGDLVRGLKRWDAFKDITEKTLRNVIDELLRLAAAGKLPALTNFLTVTKQTAKNRKPTFTVEYRK